MYSQHNQAKQQEKAALAGKLAQADSTRGDLGNPAIEQTVVGQLQGILSSLVDIHATQITTLDHIHGHSDAPPAANRAKDVEPQMPRSVDGLLGSIGVMINEVCSMAVCIRQRVGG